MRRQMQQNEQGFSLIELIVVIAMIAVIFAIVVFNFNSQKYSRGVKIAGNELVANLRRLQTASLTGKDFLPAVSYSPKYYVLRINTQTPPNTNLVTYTMYKVSKDLSGNVKMDPIESPIIQNNARLLAKGVYETPGITGASTSQYDCIDIGFELPFGKIYTVAQTSPCDFVTKGFDAVVAPDAEVQKKAQYTNKLVEIKITDSKTQTEKGSVFIDEITEKIISK